MSFTKNDIEGFGIFIKSMNEYLDTKSNLEIGEIFSKNYYLQGFDLAKVGDRIKNNFFRVSKQHKILEDKLNKFDNSVFEEFTSVAADILLSLLTNVRSVGDNLPEFERYKIHKGGERPYLFDVDNNFIILYSTLIHYAVLISETEKVLAKKVKEVLKPKLDEKLYIVDDLIKDLGLYKGEASAKKTKDIYKKKYSNYKRTVEVYELYILLLVCLSVTLVLGQLFAHNFFDTLNISTALMIKLTILALIATLFTYCFKQISFYRKIAEQAHQTYMELEALPEFLTHLPEEKQHEIRADLAKRYFGQNLFDSIKEDSISIQEQAKANAEVLKSTSALLDVIKKQNSQT